MSKYLRVAAAAATALLAALPAHAQTPLAPAPASDCELHVWPTENYVVLKMGLLSGFGGLGALADLSVQRAHVKTVKDLLREHLSPAAQIDELNKIGLTRALKLDGYRVIVEEPTPFNEDVKKDPALKEKNKAMNARLKSGARLTNSTAGCYAELVGTMVFYYKAVMYGSNLFSGWIYRSFPEGGKVKSFAGSVKNPLENFPEKTDAQIEPATLEVRDAYGKDFVEYLDKKVFKVAAR